MRLPGSAEAGVALVAPPLLLGIIFGAVRPPLLLPPPVTLLICARSSVSALLTLETLVPAVMLVRLETVGACSCWTKLLDSGDVDSWVGLPAVVRPLSRSSTVVNDFLFTVWMPRPLLFAVAAAASEAELCLPLPSWTGRNCVVPVGRGG